MTKPILKDIFDNEERIMKLEEFIIYYRTELTKYQMGSPQYRKVWFKINHYQVEMDHLRRQRGDFLKEYR